MVEDRLVRPARCDLRLVTPTVDIADGGLGEQVALLKPVAVLVVEVPLDRVPFGQRHLDEFTVLVESAGRGVRIRIARPDITIGELLDPQRVPQRVEAVLGLVPYCIGDGRLVDRQVGIAGNGRGQAGVGVTQCAPRRDTAGIGPAEYLAGNAVGDVEVQRDACRPRRGHLVGGRDAEQVVIGVAVGESRRVAVLRCPSVDEVVAG